MSDRTEKRQANGEKRTEDFQILKCPICERVSYTIGEIQHPWHEIEDEFPQAKSQFCPDCQQGLLREPPDDPSDDLDYRDDPPSDQYPIILW